MPYNDYAYVGLNQEKTCIVTNIRGGYDIFKMDPLLKIASSTNGKYGIIEMFGSSSLIAVVGSGEDPSYSPRHLLLINMVDSSEICNLTFVSSIICVKMTLNRLVVALQDRIYIYNLLDMKLLHTINDLNNDKGVLSVSYNLQNNILCYSISTPVGNPEAASVTSNNILTKNNTNDYGRNMESSTNERLPSLPSQPDEPTCSIEVDSDNSEYSGAVRSSETLKYNNTKVSGDIAIFDLNSLRPRFIIEAHKNSIRTVKLSNDGTLLATASKLGTIIRVFDVSSGKRIAQFRRGRYPSKIKCISFSSDKKFLIVSSSSHNLHIFAIKTTSSPEDINNYNTNDSDDSNTLQSNFNNMDEDRLDEISNISELNDDDDDDDFVVLTSQNRSVKYPRNMKALLKSSSRALSRGATKHFNKYFINTSTSKLEPKRNIAYCKIPVDINTSSNLVAIGDLQDIRKSDYPEIFQYDKDSEKIQDWVKIRKIFMINEDGYILIFLFDPLIGGECILLSKLLLLSVD